ncbi:SDR family NAD(P)-dependent oxidoreductase [Sulfuracidifex metallicus]|uniref:SDR family NAD(P)-dependent oxidoreductase n=1 Tax=Sulfuracidifex metallicus DSM 6482 = JCM 9184 TaxID=523847 RepID=A0A6A9QLW4_SULME|nr:SDR family oxidoreductase [Sulfuracidifex metallicus]MUN29996.1 SDR family NAD(P)-dependent oxidoreductase [Sulfuracidifex metallicus DSM 6482 = JCM 9184]WOE51951.1 SDR family oxidoreductase [Sulfuracidifex metallicus DSM 6482 = JCM 9184]
MMAVAIVTGASKGIGKATSSLLKEHGYTVVSISRTMPEVGDMRISLDVTDKGSVVKVVEELVNKFGGVDVLVNNAGFGVYGKFTDTSLDEEEYMIKTNLVAPIVFTKLVLPHMLKKGSGSIVNVVSEAAYVSTTTLAVYSASKAGLASFTNSLWATVSKMGIKVSGIYPGPVKTNFTSHPSFAGMKTNIFDKYAVEAEDVARAVLKGIRTGKREIYVPSRLKVDPYFLKLSSIMQEITYRLIRRYF